MNADQVKTIVYELLFSVAATMLIPLFVAFVCAMWALAYQLIYKPLDRLTEKLDVFGERVYEIEVNHSERLGTVETHQENLLRRVENIEGKLTQRSKNGTHGHDR